MNPCNGLLGTFAICALAVGLGVSATEAKEPEFPRPNILFVMADNHAAHAISAYGSKINQTPNLDRIAKGGMRFNHCFAVNAICVPGRAEILPANTVTSTASRFSTGLMTASGPSRRNCGKPATTRVWSASVT
jgi:hypothetical protein